MKYILIFTDHKIFTNNNYQKIQFMDQAKPVCKNSNSFNFFRKKQISFICDDDDCKSCNNYHKNKQQIKDIKLKLQKANKKCQQCKFLLLLSIILFLSFIFLVGYDTENDSCDSTFRFNINQNITDIFAYINEIIQFNEVNDFIQNQSKNIEQQKQIPVQARKKNIQNLLISKKFEHFLKQTKAKIQSYELKFRLSGLIITQQQQLDILQMESNKLFNELKNNSLAQFTKFEESVLKIKEQNVAILSTLQFIELINQLESEANEIINQFLDAIEDNINLQIMNFEIYSLQKLNFFSKKIKQLNLLYKASENYFQISKFWDKCSGKPHTLVLIRTQFDKIIGGYRPLPWNKTINNYEKDENNESFIFSITQKHKLKLISGKQKYAMFQFKIL